MAKVAVSDWDPAEIIETKFLLKTIGHIARSKRIKPEQEGAVQSLFGEGKPVILDGG
jgi:hypothetical protein